MKLNDDAKRLAMNLLGLILALFVFCLLWFQAKEVLQEIRVRMNGAKGHRR